MLKRCVNSEYDTARSVGPLIVEHASARSVTVLRCRLWPLTSDRYLLGDAKFSMGVDVREI